MTAEALPNTQQLLGTVLAVQANYYRVQLDLGVEEWERRTKGVEGTEEVMGVSSSPPSPSSHPPLLLCTRRTRLKKIGQQVMVGDRVVVEEPDWAGGRGAIAEVLPRKNQLDRPAIANVDQILLVFAVADPPLEPYQLSRFLIKAESTGLHVVLCLNKSDLITSEQQAEINQRLIAWGYQPRFISVYEGINIDDLAESLKQQTTVLAGPSGVGKSSLINALIPNVNLRVGEISGKLARGRHTTRHVELFELPKGGFLADTPGFNQPDLDCTPEELASYFPEIRERLAIASCRFSDCLHRNEPGCVVQGNWERYQHYLEFLEEAIARQTQLNQQADPESTVKAKTIKQGQTQYEPKLESKKYRRASRRTQLQELEQLYEDSEE
ncbi:small ribosomal subunit biogenesis GTPase RsgA [Chlorogloeopsis fritschii PCC 9212]|uniref:Small ribosomal subunit biogenesis GTPase RsgA n=1 Tax=Chlorogloeopsis fritschii PCC 6912 TaxID=211165 RepID=A0A3S1FVY1_CHLFR|nr:small ribosomal subunit biogenesis GTPase RsgA [Chlorogloeopsis fritschii]RUR86889.1 putative ribosome biogenesis GTPase RsgA [Chlorogloeopsis fritschii PCC 6912]